MRAKPGRSRTLDDRDPSGHQRPPQGEDAPDFLALGVERFGLASLAKPRLAALLALLIVVVAAFGVARIKVDDSLSQLFKSDTPAFHLYEDTTRRFPSSEYDVLVVVEGAKLLERDTLGKLRDLVTDLQLVDGTAGVVSLFSAREPPVGDATPAALVPDDLPEGSAYQRLVDRIRANEIIRGKLLADDGKLALIVLSLNPDVADSDRLSDVVGDIRKTMKDDLVGAPVTAELSGVPVMRLEIRKAVERDRLVYNAIGFLAGCLIAIAFFRRVSYMVVAAAPPLLAIVVALGALGWMGFRLNMFLNVMTPLIMVVSFSDSMQLVFAARDRVLRGQPPAQAFRAAVNVVGPACVLTHATAAISFIALLFSNSDLIRGFGEAGLVSTAVALAMVLTLAPALGALLVRPERAPAADAARPDAGIDALRAFCRWIALRMVARPGLYSLIALLVIIGLGVNYATLHPRYQLADQVPDKQNAVAASHRIDAELSGANPIDVLIQFPKGETLYAPQTLATIAAVHTAVEQQAGVGNVWSLETLRRWLAARTGATSPRTLKGYVDALPTYLVRRFISQSEDSVVVSGRIPDIDSSQLLPVIQGLDERLAAVRAAHPGYGIAVTGLAVVSATSSDAMIGRLNAGLTIEVLFVAAFIGLAFRSFVVALAAVLPSVFPALLSGTLLSATGVGLQFSSVVALIVSFGLGLSATIHFLNRMRRERRPGADIATAVERATVLIGPALILTSIVLAFGLATTVFSDLPSLRVFGWLSAFNMLAPCQNPTTSPRDS